MLVSPPGYQFVSLDYSAIEVVTAAMLVGDAKMLEACRSGDPHLATAKMITGRDDLTKDSPERQSAKISNFGLIFLGGAQGFIEQARDLFDVTYTFEEADRIVREWYNLYKGMKRERSLAYDIMQKGPDCIEVTNGVGFRRYLEGANRKPTSWMNTRVQSLAGYGMKSSFAYLREALLLPFIIGMVHDELLFEFPDDYADEGTYRAQQCMLRGMQDVLGKTAPIKVEPHIARYWM